MRRHARRSTQDGFTFTEVLIVVAVIALLMAIFVPGYLHQRDRARDAVVKQSVQTIAMGLRVYNLDHDGQYPLDVSGPNGKYPLTDSSGKAYIDSWPNNPWTGTPMKNTSKYSKGNFRYAGFSSVASTQPNAVQIDECSLLGWVTSKSRPFVASEPGPLAVRIDSHRRAAQK
jgi:prepilin-type N-terminal cleavage/methylation domain-containing protein